MPEKQYLKGNGKAHQNQYGTFHTISINKEEIASLPDKNGYVTFAMFERKQPDDYGNTHYLQYTYYDDNDGGSQKKVIEEDDTVDDLPF